MNPEQVATFKAGEYMGFSSLKKSGEHLATPAWLAPLHGAYSMFSAGEAGKVKRLRNFSDARIARCTVTGEIHEADAHLLTTTEEEALALRAPRLKYGLKMRLTDLLSSLSGKKRKRA